MNVLRYVSIGIFFAAIITGCGQTTVETLKVPTQAPANAVGRGMTAVILPFADYSNADNLLSAFRRNLAITEALTDSLTVNGFSLPVQEDVFDYLVNKNIINFVSYDASGTATLATELEDNDWSELMKSHIRNYMNVQSSGKTTKISETPGTHGLTAQNVVKIGRQFGADYIIRGRILEFKTRQEHTWAPWKRGIVPFVIGGTNQLVFGFADTDKYDEWGQMISGGTYGAILGYNAEGPFSAGSSSDGFFGIADGVGANMVVWGAIGAGLGHMAHNTGRVDQVVVQMRIWVQDAYSGKVVWTNRVDVKVSPESVLADRQYDGLFDQAITKGVTSLIDNFVSYGVQ